VRRARYWVVLVGACCEVGGFMGGFGWTYEDADGRDYGSSFERHFE
jgi:hypothetical protein